MEEPMSREDAEWCFPGSERKRCSLDPRIEPQEMVSCRIPLMEVACQQETGRVAKTINSPGFAGGNCCDAPARVRGGSGATAGGCQAEQGQTSRHHEPESTTFTMRGYVGQMSGVGADVSQKLDYALTSPGWNAMRAASGR